MSNVYNNFINGQFVKSSSGKSFDNLNPADHQKVIGSFVDSNTEDVNAAVQAAQQAFPSWAAMPGPQRGELILKASQILIDRKKELAEVIVREMGKNMPSSMGDIQSSADAGIFFAGEGRRLYGQTTTSALHKRWALTKRVPVGVCGLITAWNAPMAIIAWKLFPALICGNTAVIKPSEDSPLTAHFLAEVLKEAGIPDGVVNIVYGKGAEVGEALVNHSDVPLISFTGSSHVGQKIAEKCGAQLKKCSLELGGKNGLIVLPDANLDEAAKAVALGAFSMSGQRCASTSRVIVHKDVKDVFVEKLIEQTKSLSIGPCEKDDFDMCPIINQKQYDSILNYIQQGKDDGLELIHGGNAITDAPCDKGCYIEPTIFLAEGKSSKVIDEEIFGPVLTVHICDSFDDAIDQMNSVNYGLTASIFTANVTLAVEALERMDAGCCYINAPTFGSEPHMPFGGTKQSGIGTREPGTQALDVFCECKTIYIDYSDTTQNSQFKVKDK